MLLRTVRSITFAVIASILLSSCGGSSAPSGGGGFRSISITPNPIKLKPNETIQLTAIIDGQAMPVMWSIAGTPGGLPSAATITSGGVLSAPSYSFSANVVVNLVSDPTKSATSPVTIDSGYRVRVSGPVAGAPTVFAPRNGQLQLSATVDGAPSQGVTWTTSAGTISTTGMLSVPNELGVVRVEARSISDVGHAALIDVTVVPPIELLDASAVRLAIPGARYPFKVNINGLPSNQVSWTATGGTVDTLGSWTAPNGAGTYTLTGTSTVDASQSVTSTVTVVPNLNIRFNFANKQILLALQPDKAPNHCANLVSLVNEKFYDGIVVHRREAGFVVQWGDPLTKTLPLTDSRIGSGGPGYSIIFEPNDLTHGQFALAMARSSSLNSGGSQIYITLQAQPSLDGNYVVFGSFIGDSVNLDNLVVGDRIVTTAVEIP